MSLGTTNRSLGCGMALERSYNFIHPGQFVPSRLILALPYFPEPSAQYATPSNKTRPKKSYIA